MLILGIEPSLTAYKTVVRTDTLYEQLKIPYQTATNTGLEPATFRLTAECSNQLS